MKACKISFSLQLLLEQIGLKNANDLIVYFAVADPAQSTVTLYLTGEHSALPVVNSVEEIPDAYIECEKIESKLKIISPPLQRS